MDAMSSPSAVFPGTFDPFTLGHLDLVRRARDLFPDLIVAVAQHPTKDEMFSVPERVALIEESLAGMDGVRVATFEGLVVEGCRNLGASVLLRGLRGSGDLEYERPMALSNRAMAPEVETVFLLPSSETAHISSTLVRQIARLGGDTSAFVPGPVLRALQHRFPESKSHD
jgi:pantetheine-phosphate adenylyltransferase